MMVKESTSLSSPRPTRPSRSQIYDTIMKHRPKLLALAIEAIRENGLWAGWPYLGALDYGGGPGNSDDSQGHSSLPARQTGCIDSQRICSGMSSRSPMHTHGHEQVGLGDTYFTYLHLGNQIGSDRPTFNAVWV